MLEEKLKILTDAAKYDASCSSSGSGRQGKTDSATHIWPVYVTAGAQTDAACLY